MKKCQNCGFSNEDNAKFCRNCGQEIIDSSRNQSCKKCGKPIIPGTRFCKYCGSMLEVRQEPVTEVKKVEKIKEKKVSSKSNSGKLAIIAIVIVVLIAVGVVISQKPLDDDYRADNQNYVESDDQNYDESNDENIPSGTVPVDIYEPNDGKDSATIVQVGDTYKGVLSSAEDKDYFCVEANGHDSLSYSFVRNSSHSIDGIGWEISYQTNDSKCSTMAWLDEKELIGECDDIDITNGYFVVWVENTRNDPGMEEVMEFVSSTEYSITFYYKDYESKGYILEGSDSQYLTKADLMGLTAEECRLARNEIYARHGRIFKDEELQAYFESFDWYYPTIQPDDFEESMLNDYEIANRDLIIEYETEKGYR